MNSPVLEFDGASVNLAEEATAAVTGIDWRIAEGESWVIGGLQGSGKSAVLEAAAGLTPVLSGTVRLFGVSLDGLTPKEARDLRLRVGVVFEGSGRLFTDLTVLENLTLPLRYHRELSFADATEAVAPLLESLDLVTVASRYPGKIGYGVAKRVALARALVLRPAILLVDDPLRSLDSTQARAMRRHLQEFNRGHAWCDGRPVTLIVTAEELRPFVNPSNQFAIIDKHGWKIVGTREQLLGDRSDAVRELLAEHSEHAMS